MSALERLQFYGDLRLRHESSFELDDKQDRHRQRLRLRFGVNYQLYEELLLGTRVVTGDADDPNSSHVSFGDAFDDLDLSLDRAFITYTPNKLQRTSFTAGKFNHAFYRNPVYGELVWDADVQPEGAIVASSTPELFGVGALDFKLGGYSVLEQSDGDDAFAAVAQISRRIQFGDATRATVSVAYYHYNDVSPDGSTALLDDNGGNATVDRDGDGAPDDFVSGFGVLNPILGIDYTGWKQPLALAIEFVENQRADIGEDQGWAAGASVGRSALAGDWRFYYQWQRIEQDAVFSPFAQDDFLFQTNHESHLFGVNHQFTDKIGLHLWGLVSARDKTFLGATSDSDADQWRIRLDLNIKL